MRAQCSCLQCPMQLLALYHTQTHSCLLERPVICVLCKKKNEEARTPPDTRARDTPGRFLRGGGAAPTGRSGPHVVRANPPMGPTHTHHTPHTHQALTPLSNRGTHSSITHQSPLQTNTRSTRERGQRAARGAYPSPPHWGAPAGLPVNAMVRLCPTPTHKQG